MEAGKYSVGNNKGMPMSEKTASSCRRRKRPPTRGDGGNFGCILSTSRAWHWRIPEIRPYVCYALNTIVFCVSSLT